MTTEEYEIIEVKEEYLYTTKEYVLLSSFFKESNLFTKALVAHVVKGPIYYTDHRDNDIKYDTLCDFLKIRMPFTYEVMFSMPFEETPLYINYTSDIITNILKWRWMIGK